MDRFLLATGKTFMMGPTHAVIGMVAGMYAAMQAGSTPSQVLMLGGLTAFSALIPDIDHPRSNIRSGLGAPGHIAFFWLPHRGITHTAIAWAVFSAVTLYFLPPPLGFYMILGYASHILADSLTRSGVPLVWPVMDYRYSFAPIRTGGGMEAVINIVCYGLIALMIFQQT